MLAKDESDGVQAQYYGRPGGCLGAESHGTGASELELASALFHSCNTECSARLLTGQSAERAHTLAKRAISLQLAVQAVSSEHCLSEHHKEVRQVNRAAWCADDNALLGSYGQLEHRRSGACWLITMVL